MSTGPYGPRTGFGTPPPCPRGPSGVKGIRREGRSSAHPSGSGRRSRTKRSESRVARVVPIPSGVWVPDNVGAAKDTHPRHVPSHLCCGGGSTVPVSGKGTCLGDHGWGSSILGLVTRLLPLRYEETPVNTRTATGGNTGVHPKYHNGSRHPPCGS